MARVHHLLLRLLRESRPYYRYYVPIALGLIAASVADLGITDGLRRLVDAAARRSLPLLWQGLAIGAGGFTISALLSFGVGYLQAWVDQISGSARQRELVRRVHQVHFDYCLNQPSGDLITRVLNNAYGAQTGLNSAAVRVVRHTAEAAATLTYLLVLQWQLALGTLVTASAAPLVLNSASPFMRRLWEDRFKQEGKLSAFVQEAVQGAEVSRALLLHRWILARFDELYRPLLRLARRGELWNRAVESSGLVLLLAGLFFVLGYGGLMATRGLVTAGTIAAFLVSFERLSWPIQGLLRIWPDLQQSLAAAARVYELVDEPPAPGMDDRSTPAVAVVAPVAASESGSLGATRIERIEFDHVTFTYPGRKEPVLHDVTFTIPGGRFTAIVGETGSGKTTIIRLLLRLFDPDSGSIKVAFGQGGSTRVADLRDLPLAAWRRLIGYVPQEPVLFSGTLEENIRLGDWRGRTGTTETDIEAAAATLARTTMPGPAGAVDSGSLVAEREDRLPAAISLAHLEELIARLPEGLETPVGEKGARLSGGERQRVAIARAAYRDPALLLLDEATSSLDNVNERLVQQALFGLSRGRTTVAIAHRLSTVVGADQILVIDGGRLTEQGKHPELLAAKGRYYELFTAGQVIGSEVAGAVQGV